MTSGERFKNKWFYMKFIGKYLSVEILLTRECTCTKLYKTVYTDKTYLKYSSDRCFGKTHNFYYT